MKNSTDFQIIDNSITMQIIQTSTLLKQNLNLLLKDYSISLEQWNVLYNIFKLNGKYQKELADIMQKDKPTITRIIDNLEKKTFILRKKHPEDRRKFLIIITDSGNVLIEKITPKLAEFYKTQEKLFTENEINTIKNTLKKININ